MLVPYYLLLGVSSILFKFTSGGYIPPGPKYRCPVPPALIIYPCTCSFPSDEGVTLTCSRVSLATLSAALAHPVVQGIPVKFLNISEFYTEKLYGEIFRGLNSTRLRIERSPRLRLILPDVFYPLRHTLKELELIDTGISGFPHEALEGNLDALETLTLDGHDISSLDKPIENLASLKHLRVSRGNVSSVGKTTFSHLGGKLIRLDLHKNNLKGVPKDTFQTLKQLEFLDVSHNAWEKLEPADFFHLTRLTWFNGSHNLIPEFRRGAFARNGFLRVLYLTHNKIKKLDAQAFRGMRLLVRLYLSDNQISEVGRGAFASSIQKIRTVDLARNNLTLVDFQMFAKLPFCEEIRVEENQITLIKAGAFNELTQVLVNISHNNLVTVEKEAFINCVNMTVLDMTHNNLKNFTKGAFDENSYADEWRLEFNKLELTADVPLKFMSQLRILNISHNALREVGRNTFPKLYELHTVDLSWNNISKVHGGVFGNIFGLRSLDLRHNSLTELGGSTLGTIPTLLELWLDHNKLRSVSNAAFTKLVSLRMLSVTHNNLTKVGMISGALNELNLSHNKISTLKKAWPEMNSLQRLSLSNNALDDEAVSEGAFSGLGALAKIDLSHNGITKVPFEALRDLVTCQYVDLSHNGLTILEKAAFGRLPIVFHLNLSNNNISMVEVKAFEGLIQLQTLDLSNNRLGPKSLPGGAFAQLVSLRSMNLSHNDIERVENGTNSLFEDNLSLLTLDLSYNSISNLYQFSFPHQQWTNYKLAHVILSHNKLIMIGREMVKGTRNSVTNLDLSYNSISGIDKGVLSNLMFLESINLEGNKLVNLEGLLPPPGGLRELKVKGNILRRIPTTLFVNKKNNFTVLDFGGNRIRSFPPELGNLIVKNGTKVLVQGNPLECSCSLIGVKRYFERERWEFTNRTEDFISYYDTLECQSESSGVKRPLREWNESDLPCTEEEEEKKIKPEPLTDVEVLGIGWSQISSPGVQVKWRVTSTTADISGFLLVGVAEDSKEILRKEMFRYDVRKGVLQPPLEGVTQICVVPLYSRWELTKEFSPEEVEKYGVCRSDFVILKGVGGAGGSQGSGGDKGNKVSLIHLLFIILMGGILMQ